MKRSKTKFEKDIEAATGMTAESLSRETAAAVAAEPMPGRQEILVEIPLEQLEESPTNPRKQFEDLAELVASVKQWGVVTPLLVRPLADSPKFEIVAGARRFRAAKKAGLESVWCDVRKWSDAQVLEVQLLENIQRKDLSPLEEAEAYQHLSEVSKYTPDQIAKRAGKSRAWVYARLKLCALAPEAKKALREGRLSASVAVPLARLPSAAMQVRALERLCPADGEPLAQRAAWQWLQEEFARSLKAVPFDLDAVGLADAPPCEKCPKNSACQTPGIFDDLERSSAWCTDTKCFDAKLRDAWSQKAAKAKERGAKVLGVAEGERLLGTGTSVPHSSRYVRATEAVSRDARRRSWKQLLDDVPAESRPQVVVAPNAKLVAVELYDRGAALKALAEAGVEWAKDANADAEPIEALEDASRWEASRRANAARQKILDDSIFAVARAVAKDGLTLPVARVMALSIDVFAVHRYLESLGLESPEKNYEMWVGKAERDALVAAVFVALSVGVSDSEDERFAALVAASKLAGVDLEEKLAEAR